MKYILKVVSVLIASTAKPATEFLFCLHLLALTQMPHTK